MSQTPDTQEGHLTERIMGALFSELNPDGKPIVFRLPAYIYNPAYSAVHKILKDEYPTVAHPEAGERFLEEFESAGVYPELRDFVRSVFAEAIAQKPEIMQSAIQSIAEWVYNWVKDLSAEDWIPQVDAVMAFKTGLELEIAGSFEIKSQWIGVEERLPDLPCTVLAWIDWVGSHEHMIVEYRDGEFETEYGEVTRWMLLPEGPKS